MNNNNSKKEKIMNKLNKIGASALCGSLAAFSAANAGDLTVSGGADLTWVSLTGQTTGNPIGMGSNWGLAGSGDTLAIPALVHALEDTVSSVRKQAVVALHRLWTPKVASALARVLVEDEEETVRFVAAQSLGQRQALSARDALRAALGDTSVWVRAEAARSLGMLGDATVIADLTLLLEHGEDGPDHDAAREALQELNDPTSDVADTGE